MRRHRFHIQRAPLFLRARRLYLNDTEVPLYMPVEDGRAHEGRYRASTVAQTCQSEVRSAMLQRKAGTGKETNVG
jgi:hypothetical protein